MVIYQDIKSFQRISFNPLQSLEQSSPKGQERTSCALKILTQTTCLLCNVIICCFSVAYLGKYLWKVFVISVTISCEEKKKRTLKSVFIVTLTTAYSRNVKQQLKGIRYFTQEGCRGGMLAQIPTPKEWCLCRGTCKTVRLRMFSWAVSNVGACAGW